MRHYEQVFILKPSLTKEESSLIIENIKETVTKNGGEIISFQDVGVRKLAYKVQKNPRGYYGVLYFKIESSKISELERVLKINEDVIKYLTVKFDTNKEIKAFHNIIAKVSRKKESYKAKVKVDETTTEAPETEEVKAEAPKTEDSVKAEA